MTGRPGGPCDRWHGTIEKVDTSHANVMVYVRWEERAKWPEHSDNWQKIRAHQVTCLQPHKLQYQDGRPLECPRSTHQVDVIPNKAQLGLLDQKEQIRLIVAGSRWFMDYDFVKAKLDKILANKVGVANIEIVWGECEGPDTLGKKYADEHGYPHKPFPADWDTHGKAAGPIRNEEMSGYGTHCVVFWDQVSSGSKDMIERARKHGLKLRVIDISGEKASPSTSSSALEHHCHIPGCSKVIEPKFLMCPGHWKQVPKDLQNEVYRHYRPGQEIDKQPSQGWILASRAAINAVTSIKPKMPIEVINLKIEGPQALDDPETVYIGRQISGWRGRYLHASPLANDHKIGRDGTGPEVVEKFKTYQLQPALTHGCGSMYNEIMRLRGLCQAGKLKRLACWCVEPGKDKACHGFSIVNAILGK